MPFLRNAYLSFRKELLRKKNFFSFNKNIDFGFDKFVSFFKYVNYRHLIYKLYRSLKHNIYYLLNLYKKINLNKYKHLIVYFFGILLFSIIGYLNIPNFFDYDKSKIKNELCKNLAIQCYIKGDIKYTFFPSPRIVIYDFVAKDKNGKKTIAKANNMSIKISWLSLSNKKNFKYNNIKLNNPKIIFDFDDFSTYKRNYNNEKSGIKHLSFNKGELKFYDKENYVVSIKDIDFKYKKQKKSSSASLEGKFLNDVITINFKNERLKDELSHIISLKLINSGIFTKINILSPYKKDNSIRGNVLLKKDKNRLSANFDYKNKKMNLKDSKVRNAFLDGKLNGVIEFSPYFNFDLDLDLKGINFNKFYSYLTNMEMAKKKKIFQINEKLNGTLNLSARKIYSKYDLIDSFESQLELFNGNILIEKLLLNLKKLGAADMTGTIMNDKTTSNFKFESNIFIDNEKKFYRKFSIYNKKNIPLNLFVSGYFDLINLNLGFNEISNDKKFKEDDVTYIEQQFNEILLEDDYKTLFDFLKFKEFIKLFFEESTGL